MLEKLKTAKQIDNAPGFYITEEGEVFKIRQVAEVDNGKGYKYVDIYQAGKWVRLYIHRIVASAFHPNPNNLSQVDHIDGVKSNNHKDNLQWLSGLENIRKCFRGDYQLISPEGEVVSFSNIRQFADENELDSSSLSKVLKGKHSHTKGWRAVIDGPTCP